MNNLNYEILSCIDNIDNVVMGSEVNVINSLMDTYSKSMTILEYCNESTDVSSYDIFQEDGNDKENIFKRIENTFLKIMDKIISRLMNILHKPYVAKKK